MPTRSVPVGASSERAAEEGSVIAVPLYDIEARDATCFGPYLQMEDRIFSPRMKTNRMKEKLKAGEAVFGVSVMIPSPQIVEMVGAAGFDWVLLDCEHGTLTLESVELMAMA